MSRNYRPHTHGNDPARPIENPEAAWLGLRKREEMALRLLAGMVSICPGQFNSADHRRSSAQYAVLQADALINALNLTPDELAELKNSYRQPM